MGTHPPIVSRTRLKELIRSAVEERRQRIGETDESWTRQRCLCGAQDFDVLVQVLRTVYGGRCEWSFGHDDVLVVDVEARQVDADTIRSSLIDLLPRTKLAIVLASPVPKSQARRAARAKRKLTDEQKETVLRLWHEGATTHQIRAVIRGHHEPISEYLREVLGVAHLPYGPRR